MEHWGHWLPIIIYHYTLAGGNVQNCVLFVILRIVKKRKEKSLVLKIYNPLLPKLSMNYDCWNIKLSLRSISSVASYASRLIFRQLTTSNFTTANVTTEIQISDIPLFQILLLWLQTALYWKCYVCRLTTSIPGDLHARIGEHRDSADVFEALYHRNPENATYIENYVRAHGHCK